jgi:acid phosphatase
VSALIGLSILFSALGNSAASETAQFSYVILVVEENHNYSDVIGNPDMPYLNSLADQYGLAANYYASTHPSIGNYMMLTTGEIITNDSHFTDTVYADNLVRRLLEAGKTWKSYAEDLPSAGYTGSGKHSYVARHNPFSFFSDVREDQVQAKNLVPFTQFSVDLAKKQLPDFSFIVPNQKNNAHNGTLTEADRWLRSNITPLISSTAFQNNGLLIIVFDESRDDGDHGGGHVPMVIVSPLAKKNYRSTTFYQHESILRLLLEGLGLTRFPGAAAAAPNMSEFFTGWMTKVEPNPP